MGLIRWEDMKDGIFYESEYISNKKIDLTLLSKIICASMKYCQDDVILSFKPDNEKLLIYCLSRDRTAYVTYRQRIRNVDISEATYVFPYEEECYDIKIEIREGNINANHHIYKEDREPLNIQKIENSFTSRVKVVSDQMKSILIKYRKYEIITINIDKGYKSQIHIPQKNIVINTSHIIRPIIDKEARGSYRILNILRALQLFPHTKIIDMFIGEELPIKLLLLSSNRRELSIYIAPIDVS